ncbi:MAG: thioesterase [Pseudomonadota bacterium]|nr:thioesterase [Pseudomonadota bacterium]
MEKYKKSYLISSFEVDVKAKLRIRSLFNLFQDIADEHAEKIGVGYSFCKANGIGWVGGAYRLKINRFPIWGEEISIETWPSASTAACAIRDFKVTDQKGHIIISATSQWVLIDTVRLRPIPLAKHLPQYDILAERALDSDFTKIPAPMGNSETISFPVHADDIDLNNHVNNALYPTWALDGFSDEYLNKHRMTALSVDFKRPATYGSAILLNTYINQNQSFSLLTAPDGLIEYARVLIDWQSE